MPTFTSVPQPTLSGHEAHLQQIGLTFGPMQTQEDADAFRALNEEWIFTHFRLEEKDRQTLSDPQGCIVARGGQVYVARLADRVVGCVALIAYGEGRFELSKMAVAPDLRGRGVGRQLLSYVLDQASLIHASLIFLGSNSVLGNAVRLYESLGFVHVAPDTLPHMGYARADVYMRLGSGVSPKGAVQR